MPSESMHNLLIATVGGSPKPLAASIAHWRPDRVVFVPSGDTASGIIDIHNELEKKKYALGEGQYDLIELTDAQDFSRCVQEMHAGLAPRVAEWQGRGEGYRCIVDFTGGTKCMSAALALVARPWHNALFSYVGGEKRDKENVGIVVSGREQVVHSTNPWDSLGHQIIEDAAAAFDRHAFGEGARMLWNAMKRILDDHSRRNELNALATLMRAYDLWSRSEYGQAFNEFEKCEKRLNDLIASLSPKPRHCVRGYINEAKSRLKDLKKRASHPTRALLEDLIADAARRRLERRHVDAVARLYRAVEATAQLRLWEDYNILTGKVALEDLPGSMRDRLEHQAKNGTVKLALQDSYEFLIQKRNPLGELFQSLGWNGSKSPLLKRNESIAGHGYSPVSQETSDELWRGALKLAELTETEVFCFPRLGQREAQNRGGN